MGSGTRHHPKRFRHQDKSYSPAGKRIPLNLIKHMYYTLCAPIQTQKMRAQSRLSDLFSEVCNPVYTARLSPELPTDKPTHIVDFIAILAGILYRTGVKRRFSPLFLATKSLPVCFSYIRVPLWMKVALASINYRTIANLLVDAV